MKEKVKIFVKKAKTGWMCHAYFTHYQPTRKTKEEAVSHFVKNLHLRNYELIELE